MTRDDARGDGADGDDGFDRDERVEGDSAEREAPRGDFGGDDRDGSRTPSRREPRREREPRRRDRAGSGERAADRPDADAPRSRDRDDTARGGFDWDASLDAPPARQTADGVEGEPDREPRGDRDAATGDDDGSGRRRRRRGRRGGRRRGGRDREGAGAEGAEAPATPRSEDDDEPLPTGYGRAPTASRPAAEGRPAEGDSRRRRRGRGRGDRQESRGDGAASESKGREGSRRRGGRGRRGDDEIRSTSSLSRGRRDDFAPVAGGYDQDDEGLDFLNVEDAARETSRRAARRPEDEELLAESGLSSVTDVPSWVEAIGIVIAGNLEARKSPGRGDDNDRGRRGRQGSRD